MQADSKAFSAKVNEFEKKYEKNFKDNSWTRDEVMQAREDMRAMEPQTIAEELADRQEGQTQMIMEMERKLNRGWFAKRHIEVTKPCRLSVCQYWLMLRYIDVSAAL